MRPGRYLLLVVAAALVAGLSGTLSGARAAGTGLHFTLLPKAPFEGQKSTIAVAGIPSGTSCTLTVAYTGGRTDPFTASAGGKTAIWTFRTPAVPPGPARVVASCGSVGSLHASMTIRWAVEAPAITITKRGYTQKLDPYGGGSSVGWGAAVRNDRIRSDAAYVTLLINYVDATNKVLGTDFANITRLPAASTFYIGGMTHLGTQTPVTRLEIVVQAKSGPPAAGTPPLVSDVAMLPGPDGYLSSLTGQLLNHFHQSMQSAAVGAVILDASGNILGGGTTYASGPVSFGAREFFAISNALTTVPVSKASSAVVSAVPTFPAVP
jgi:hypothetical protein